MVGVNGEVGRMIQNGPQIGGSASLEDRSLNMQATDEAATTEVVVSTGFE